MPATEVAEVEAEFLLRTRMRIKALRQRSGLTLEQVAAVAGMSRSALSRLENGTRPLTLRHVCRLARALGVTPDTLLAAPAVAKPAVEPAPERTSDGREWQALPLPTASAFQAQLITLSPESAHSRERSHPGRQWLFVLTGTLRLNIAGHTRIVRAGQDANFNTQYVHQLIADGEPTAVLSLFQPS